MKITLTSDDFLKIFLKINETLKKNELFLCELDSVVGDGDHGTTIARGFRVAIHNLEQTKCDSISDILMLVGNTMISEMGGASGPLFGSLFIEMGISAKGKDEINIANLHDMLSKASAKIMEIGKAKRGDKTLLDSLLPVVDYLQDVKTLKLDMNRVFINMLSAAKAGVEETKQLRAKKGRARYASERSIGHQDAGATSFCLMIEAAIYVITVDN